MESKRCCITCQHYVPREHIIQGLLKEQEQHDITDVDIAEVKRELELSPEVKGVCGEGGYTEVGDADLELTEEECCAWVVKECK